MQRIRRVPAAVGAAAVAVVLGAGSRPEAEQARSVRVAVIGGMTMTEM